LPLLPELTHQFLPEVFPQRIQINILDSSMEQMIVASLVCTLGLSDPDPVGGFVTGAFKTGPAKIP